MSKAWMISVGALLMLLSIGCSSQHSLGIENMGSSIYGRITDEETGLPIENVTIQIGNGSKMMFLYAVTDTNGEYSIQVGTQARFYVHCWHSNYNYNLTYVMSDMFGSVRVDMTMEPYKNNVMGFVSVSPSGPIQLEGVPGILLNEDPEGISYPFVLDEHGNFEVNVLTGNYTLHLQKRGFVIDDEVYYIQEGETKNLRIHISPVDAGPGSPHILLQYTMIIPPKSYGVYTFNITEIANLYLSVSSNIPVNVLSSTHEMYLNYQNWSGKGTFEFDHDFPLFLYDFALGGMKNGGMDIVAWEDPYHIIVENNSTRTSWTFISLRYEDAMMKTGGIEYHPFQEKEGGLLEGNGMLYLLSFSGVGFCALLGIALFLIHLKPQAKTVYL